jgi:hypothetical protein
VSPTASIFHGLAVGLLLAVMRLFGWAWEADAFVAGAVVLVVPLAWMGRDASKGHAEGPPSLLYKEMPRILLAFAAVVVPSLAIWLIPGRLTGSVNVHPGDHEATVLAMVVIAVASAGLIFLSGLIDWFYVRPQLRGTLGSICATSFESRWRGLTRIWLLHRAAAVLGIIAGSTAIVALTANAWIKAVDDSVAGAVAAVATIVGGYYISRTAPLLAIAINPPVQIGDVIEIAEEFNVHKPEMLREYFVVDVALEGVKLLKLEDDDVVRRDARDKDRTHDRTVDVADIAKLLRGRRPIRKPCKDTCRKLTPHCACEAGAWSGPPKKDEGDQQAQLTFPPQPGGVGA